MGQVVKLRAATYARYSSDIQNDKSIEDQAAICKQLADRQGIKIITGFSDRAMTSVNLFDRDGLLNLLKEAKSGRFNVVIVESIDRISRDPEHLNGIFKRLTFCGVKLISVNEGEANQTQIGLRSLIGSIFLKDLADKVRRGHLGRAREGKIPGSVGYGYRIVPGKPGEPEVNEDQAKVVRRIYQAVFDGASPRAICKVLTLEGVPGPKGKGWHYQCLVGGGVRLGMAHNPIYAGRVVWNRTRNDRNPDTGRRIKKLSPEAEVTTHVPRLQIIGPELWEAVQAKLSKRAPTTAGTVPFVARSKHLLAGMLRCGACGGHLRNKSRTRNVPYAVCKAGAVHMTCENTRTYNMDHIQAAVLKGFKYELTDPEAIMEATKAYHADWSARSKAARGEAIELRAQLTRTEAKITRLVDAIENSDLPVATLTEKLQGLELDRVSLAERLRLVEAEGNVVDLHPATLKGYQANLEQLYKALKSDPAAPEVAAAFQNVIDSIIVHPAAKGEKFEITPLGRLGAIMGVDLFPKPRSMGKIVAQEGVLQRQAPVLGVAGVAQAIPLGRWQVAA